MTTYQRMSRMYEHKEADRVPITDQMWDSTIARWKGEGLPDIDVEDIQKYLGLDRIITIGLGDIDTTPKFTSRIIEETDTYIIDPQTSERSGTNLLVPFPSESQRTQGTIPLPWGMVPCIMMHGELQKRISNQLVRLFNIWIMR